MPNGNDIKLIDGMLAEVAGLVAETTRLKTVYLDKTEEVYSAEHADAGRVANSIMVTYMDNIHGVLIALANQLEGLK